MNYKYLMVRVAHFQYDAHNPDSVEEFKLWLDARNRHAWIEPLGDEDTLRTYLKENHPESLDGNHPVYLFVDDQFEEHKLMLVGSTPITYNFLKNFKRLYNEAEQEREDEAAQKEELPPVLSSVKTAEDKELYSKGYQQGWQSFQFVRDRYGLEELEKIVRSHSLLAKDEDLKKSFDQKYEQVPGSAEEKKYFKLGLMKGFVDAAYKQFSAEGVA